jgi:hypothetical protein
MFTIMSSHIGKGYTSGWQHLESILKIPSGKFRHLRHIVRKASNRVRPKCRYLTESISPIIDQLQNGENGSDYLLFNSATPPPLEVAA